MGISTFFLQNAQSTETEAAPGERRAYQNRRRPPKEKGHPEDDHGVGRQTNSADSQKIQLLHLPGIDEVNMFREDGTVIHFRNPKVTAAPSSNTFTVHGANEIKRFEEIPDAFNQIGLEGLQAWARSKGFDGSGPMMGGPPATKKNDLDAIPETSGNFDEAEDCD